MLSRKYFSPPVKLVHAAFVRDESHCIERMLKTILPYVDESYLLIDDRTEDNTKEIAESMGCTTQLFKFENFGKTKNTLLKWVNDKTDFIMGLAPDETISPEFGEQLKPLAQKIINTDIDCVWFSRRHWWDLEMTNEANDGPVRSKWYPDWQARFLRADFPRIHMVKYVHEVVQGTRQHRQVQLDINHFNLYYKKLINYDWDRLLADYKVLEELQRKEGGANIWPT